MTATECNLLDALVEGATTQGHPYNSSIILCGAVVLLTFIVSTLSKNYSQVDKIWSIVPFVYAWIAVVDSRTLLMAIVATIWGIRLTWNFNRRGGYEWPPWAGDEDYRWAEIQKGKWIVVLKNPVAWALFNFGFVSLYQNLLLLLTAAPSFVAYTVATDCQPVPLGPFDYIATCLVLTCIIMESIADNQQFAFQTEKYRKRNAGEKLTGDYADGFNQSGFFAIVRKPNYAAEQATWVSYYIFSIQATGRVWNWSALGFVLLCVLFQVSSWFTEKLTLPKYPKYSEYMERVPLFVPNLFAKQKSKGQ
jgi:steroid 5-alpha reductase family enzyme